MDLTIPGPGVYTWFSLYNDVVYNIMHDIISQHYQKDADGLCCRLKHSIDKAKDVEYVVSMSDFKDSTLCQTFTFLPIGILIYFFSLVGGWAIPRKQLIKKSPIGKGEFGGERERERGREGEGGGWRKGEREYLLPQRFSQQRYG